MEAVSSRNHFTFEPEEPDDVIYIGEVTSFGESDEVAFKTGVLHFLLVLHSMDVDHPWRDRWGELEFGHG